MAKVILVGGSIATGKSTLSKKISVDLCIPRVAMDELKDLLFGYVGSRDRRWSSRIGAALFPVFLSLVELHLERREDVIAEAVFNWWPEDPEWMNSLEQRYEAEVKLIWLMADPRVARRRFLERAASGYHPGHRHGTDVVIDEFDQKYFNKTLVPPPHNGKTKIVDTTDFSAVDHDEILKWI